MKMNIKNEIRIKALLAVGDYVNINLMTSQVKAEEVTELWRDTNKIKTVLEKYEARCDNDEMFDEYYPSLRSVQALNDYLYNQYSQLETC